MSNHIVSVLLSLLRAAFYGRTLTESERSDFAGVDLKSLLGVAKKHDVIHLVAKAIIDNGLITKDSPYYAVCQKAQVMAVYRYEHLNFELQTVAKLFETAEIKFLPLKGSVLRAFYPEPWMRTSCDIDVLVHESDLEKAVELLQKECGYKEVARTTCDIAFEAKSGCHIELHFNLISDEFANGAHNILKNVWDYAEPKDDYKNWLVLSDDMFYFYHIAHMSKHFENGGCGIRPFLDLFILDNLTNVDKEKRDELLIKSNMLKFADGARKLSRVWFGDEQHDTLTELMESYLLYGGAFGTMTNKIAVGQQKTGGKKSYALSRIFPSQKFMSVHFKYVENHAWLLPVAYVHRAFVILFKGNAANSLKELKASSEVSSEKSDSTGQMLSDLGLL